MRLQRPTVSAEMSFMLAVAKFFIPGFALGGITPTPFQSYDILLTGGLPRLLKITTSLPLNSKVGIGLSNR